MKRITVLLTVAVLVSNASFGDIPHHITHQGYLTDPGGAPVTGTRLMVFRLFTAPTGGTPVWSQSFPSVTVTRGVFTVRLDVSGVDFNTPYHIETVVEGDVLSPRPPLTSVPYALGPWSVIGSNLSYLSGNVGIGTTSPSAKLDIVPTGSTPNLQLKARLQNTGDDIQVRNPGNDNLAFRAYYGSSISTLGGYILQGYRRASSGGALHLQGVCTDDQSTVDGAVIIRGMLNDDYDNLVNAPILDVEKGDGTSLMLVGANGNVGIGTTTPSAKLDIVPTGTTTGVQLKGRTYNSGDDIQGRNPGDNNLAYRLTYLSQFGTYGGGSLEGYRYVANGSALVLEGHATDGATSEAAVKIMGSDLTSGNLSSRPILSVNQGDHTPLVTVTANGSVGIGTTTPDQKLGVTGMFGIYPSAFVTPTTRGLFQYHTGTQANILAYNFPGSDPDNLGLAGKEIELIAMGSLTGLFIDQTGNVGVRMSSPTEALEVNGNVKIGGATIKSGTGTPEGSVTGNKGDLYLRTDGGAGTTMYVKESGTGTNTGWVGK